MQFVVPPGVTIVNGGGGAGALAQRGPGPRADGLIATSDIEGCWICCCFPFFWWALYEKKATGPDTLKHAGCLISPFLCPFEEHRERHPGSNGFFKIGDPGNIDQYSDANCACNGLSCAMKIG